MHAPSRTHQSRTVVRGKVDGILTGVRKRDVAGYRNTPHQSPRPTPPVYQESLLRRYAQPTPTFVQISKTRKMQDVVQRRPVLRRGTMHVRESVSEHTALSLEMSQIIPDAKQESKWFNKSTMMYRFVTSIAVVLMVLGGASFTLTIKNNHTVTKQARVLAAATSQAVDTSTSSNSTTTSSSEIPSEAKVPDTVVASYDVPANEPKYIHISKLGSYRSRVLGVGLTDDGAIATPKSVWDAGWYTASTTPGAGAGAALIVGHVAGPTTSGIFYKLHTLELGDEIEVIMGDDSVRTFSVVSSELKLVDEINTNDLLVSRDVDRPGLTLMTCGGDFDVRSYTYNKRTIVYATLKD